MRKINIVAVTLAIVLFALNIAQFVLWPKSNDKLNAQYAADIANLQLELDSFGNRVTVYTINDNVKAGDLVTSDLIVPMDTYETLVSDQYITDITDIEGRFFKIAVNPGTPLLSNMFMDEELDPTMRDHDIILDRMPVGVEEGDYVDIRMTLPYGDDYIVLPHKRIYSINDSTIKMYLTEYEWNVYQGALIDYFLNSDYGCTLYAARYIEPGLQQEATAFYAVPTNIAALLQKNPNIVDRKEAASLNSWREQMEELLVLFRTDADTIESDAGKLSSGRSELNSSVESDRTAVSEEKKEAEANNGSSEEISDDFWADTATGG